MATREQMKEEANKRIKMWNLHKNPVNEFINEGKINLSEKAPIPGILYWLDEEQEKMVKEFEEQNNCLVYHVIHDYTNIGELYTLLFVSAYDEEWEMDIESIKENVPFCYVINKDAPWCSEFGSCYIVPANGGLERRF